LNLCRVFLVRFKINAQLFVWIYQFRFALPAMSCCNVVISSTILAFFK
jgi:hypothetical protein